MEIEGCQEIDLDFEPHDLVDNNQFSDAMCAEKEVGGISLGIDENDHLPELHNSNEPERNKRNGRYNLRKSLAWDSAFFTSAGVLDAEELSSMITGTDNSQKRSLPGIQEDITGSTESLSTLESDNLTLEGCEDDLFVDIRASIQRSSKKASHLINSSCKKAATEVDSSAVSALKKENIVSEDKNPKLGLKKTSSLPTGRISKSQLKQIPKLAGKPVKQDYVRSQVASVAKTGETNSTLPKPLKSIPSSTAAAKRDSIGIARVKSESANSRFGATGTVSSKGTQPSRVPVSSVSRKPLPKPAVSSKSSLLSSSVTSSVQSLRSSTSSDSSVNTSSGVPAKPKSTLMTARRNIVKSGSINTGPSGSIPKNPSRAAPNNKLPSPTLSSCVMSAKISPSVSPASSISEWSSASSSSSMANQRCNNSRTSLDTNSCKSIESNRTLLDPRDRSAVPTAERHKNQVVNSTSNTSKKSSTQAGTLQAPAKPTGLRMPSPKIGFFDGVKSPARTPNGPKQPESGLRTAFPKNGDSFTPVPIRSTNSKQKSVKIPTSRMMTSLSNIKSASPKAPSPVSFQEKPNASSISIDVNGSSSVSLGVRGSSTGETCQKQEKIKAEDGVASTVAIDKENLDTSSLDKNVNPRNMKTLSDEAVLVDQDLQKNNFNSHAIEKGYLDNLSVGKNVGPGDIQAVSDEDLLINHDHLKKYFDSHAGDKGNSDDLNVDVKAGPGGIKIVFDVEVQINECHLRNISDLHSFDQGGHGDVKTVCDEDVLINQGDVKENSDSHATDQGTVDDSSMDINVSPSDSKIDLDELINQDHLKKFSDSDASSMKKTLSSDEDVLVNQGHVKENSDSPATDQGTVDNLSMYKSVGTSDSKIVLDELVNQDDLKKSSDEDVLINRGHVKENSDSHATDQGTVDDSSMDKDVGLCDSKIVLDELIHQDHLKKSSDSDALSMGKNLGSDEDGLINLGHVKENSDSHATDQGTVDDSKNAGPSDSKIVLGELINQDHLKKSSYSDALSMDKNLFPGDIKTSSENVMINQDHLKNSSDFHAIDEGNSDGLSMGETVGPSDIITVSDEDAVISKDHGIDMGSSDDLIMDKNVGDGDIKGFFDEEVLINLDLLQKNSDSHAIDTWNLDDLSLVENLGPRDIKTVADREVPISQDHFKENSDSHAIDKGNTDNSSMDKNVGCGDIKILSSEDVLIRQDHLAFGEGNLDDSNVCKNMGPEGIKTVSDVIVRDHLKKSSGSHAIGKGNIDETRMDKNVGCGDIEILSSEDVLIRQDHLAFGEGNLDDSNVCKNMGPEGIKTVSDVIDEDHLKKSSDSHAIGTGNIDDLSENVDPGEERKLVLDEDVLINQDHLKQNHNSHPICEAFVKENDNKKENVNEFTCELKVNSSVCASESAACRAPFSLKNTLDSDGCIDMLQDLVAEKTVCVLPSSEQKENI